MSAPAERTIPKVLNKKFNIKFNIKFNFELFTTTLNETHTPLHRSLFIPSQTRYLPPRFNFVPIPLYFFG